MSCGDDNQVPADVPGTPGAIDNASIFLDRVEHAVARVPASTRLCEAMAADRANERSLLIVFRSRLRAEHEAEYQRLGPEIEALGRSMPGFLSFESYTDEDGRRVSIVEFESESTLRAWREHPDHLEAQRQGRERFYAEYSIEVCEKIREAQFRFESSETR